MKLEKRGLQLTSDFQLNRPANQLCFGEEGSFAPDLEEDIAGETGAKETVAESTRSDISYPRKPGVRVGKAYVCSSS